MQNRSSDDLYIVIKDIDLPEDTEQLNCALPYYPVKILAVINIICGHPSSYSFYRSFYEVSSDFRNQWPQAAFATLILTAIAIKAKITHVAQIVIHSGSAAPSSG